MDARGIDTDIIEAGPTARIVLVEGLPLLLSGLEALLAAETDFEIVGAFGCAESSLDAILRLRPDVVVTELALPGRSGVELLGDIKLRSPRTRTVVLTSRAEEPYVRSALHSGANGYVLKDASCAELMLAIRSVALGRQFLCKAISSKILSDYLAGYAPPRICAGTAGRHSITQREREVLTQIALGNSNKSIARELGVSPKTVEKHRSNLMRKLQLHNAAAITMFAIRNGMTSSHSAGAARGRRSEKRPGSVQVAASAG